MPDDPKPDGTSLWALFWAVPALVYFLFPHLYLLPYVLATGSQIPPSPAVQVLFAPVAYLAEKFPPYEALLMKESEWTGVY